MKITDVRAYCLGFQRTTPSQFFRSWVVVRIGTDEGLVGWGEASDAYGHTMAPAVKAVVEDEIARLVVGKDPLEPKALTVGLKGLLYRTTNLQGIAAHAVSAVEIACWDILGKATGRSVSQLLGRVRDRVPIYAAGTLTFSQPPEWYGPFFDPFLERGVRSVKVRVGKQFDWDVAMVLATRDYVGRDVNLLVDAKYNYTLPSALRFLDAVSLARLYLLEEPFPPQELSAMARLVAASPTPIAYGESLTRLQDFRLLIDHQAANVFSPDSTVSGGLYECVKIGVLAEAFGLPVCLHSGGLTAIGIAANLHLAAALPNLSLLEYDAAPEQPLRDQIAPGARFSPACIEDGQLSVPEGPGLGIEVDEDALERFAYLQRPPEWEFPEYGRPHI